MEKEKENFSSLCGKVGLALTELSCYVLEETAKTVVRALFEGACLVSSKVLWPLTKKGASLSARSVLYLGKKACSFSTNTLLPLGATALKEAGKGAHSVARNTLWPFGVKVVKKGVRGIGRFSTRAWPFGVKVVKKAGKEVYPIIQNNTNELTSEEKPINATPKEWAKEILKKEEEEVLKRSIG